MQIIFSDYEIETIYVALGVQLYDPKFKEECELRRLKEVMSLMKRLKPYIKIKKKR